MKRAAALTLSAIALAGLLVGCSSSSSASNTVKASSKAATETTPKPTSSATSAAQPGTSTASADKWIFGIRDPDNNDIDLVYLADFGEGSGRQIAQMDDDHEGLPMGPDGISADGQCDIIPISDDGTTFGVGYFSGGSGAQFSLAQLPGYTPSTEEMSVGFDAKTPHDVDIVVTNDGGTTRQLYRLDPDSTAPATLLGNTTSSNKLVLEGWPNYAQNNTAPMTLPASQQQQRGIYVTAPDGGVYQVKVTDGSITLFKWNGSAWGVVGKPAIGNNFSNQGIDFVRPLVETN